ncbi:S-layer homology domain-containing protein [Mesobacillus subterraneus]|uniref:SLH domain-containing protein n=2 Tax=Mesobacillus TaxID=2675231 RepID=A0A0D6ZGW6_9BACI|nr:S-layer homology domain-containing protein [Mesobacillus subterraneus]KIY23888.1 hypothetical protein UB32_00375 [Mesobacillus subterraneus]
MAYQPKSYRKFVATAATATLVASAIAPAAMASSHFEDVAPKYKDAVDYLVNNGISQGTTESTFGTHENIKRGDLAIWLAKALKLDTASAPASGFEDTAGTRYDAYVSVLKSKGYISGKSTTEFAPNATVTRGEMAIMLSNAYDLKSDVATSFTDAVGNYKTAIQGLYAYEVTSGKTETTFGTSQNITRGDLAIFLKRAAEVVKTPQVVSVSAVNAKQLIVKFNKAVDKSTVITSGNVINANFKVNGVALSGTNAASLSEDGKTLTITSGAGTWEGTYMFSTTADTVKDTEGAYVAVYNQVLDYTDTVAPTLLGSETVNASTVKLMFSEPLKTKGTVVAKLANGTDISSLVSSSVVGSDLVLDLSSASIPANSTINVTVLGATDFSDNLLAVNPTSASVVKGAKDGVAPTVASVTPVNAKKFEIKLSEQVQNFVIGDVKVNGVALVAPATLTQDATDKTKYTVQLASAVSGLTTISVDASAFADLSGEDNAAFSQIVNFAADTTAPTLASATVKADTAGKQKLHLVFNEDVTKIASGTVTLTATEVSNYVTTSTSLTFAAADLVAVSNTTNEFAIELADISKTGPVALVKDATYTVDLAADLFEDTAGNNNVVKTSAFSFTRGSDVNSTKPSLDLTIDSAESGNLVAANGILVVDENTIKVKFIGDIDGATATNIANYQVAGATVKSASLNSSNEVTIKLEANSNQYTGTRTVKVTGVKTKAGVAMNDYTTTEYLEENVVPVVTNVALTSITQDDAGTTGVDETATVITLTASEAVALGGSDTADFKLFIDGVEVTTGITSIATTVGSSSDKIVVTIAGKALSATDFSKGVQLRAKTTLDIADSVGNLLNVGTGLDVRL